MNLQSASVSLLSQLTHASCSVFVVPGKLPVSRSIDGAFWFYAGGNLLFVWFIIGEHAGPLKGENCDKGRACFTIRLPQAKEDNSNEA